MKRKGITRFLLTVLVFCIVLPTASLQSFAQKDGKTIVVSMGDSYSSGEGIEPFIDASDYEDHDFLAHRSELSWPGQLKFNGNTLERYDEDTNPDGTWYFVASSGAETVHFNGRAGYKKDGSDHSGKQSKIYDRNGIYVSDLLDKQLAVFSNFNENEVDYVTMTIGGNDLGFIDIITSAVTNFIPFVSPTKLIEDLNDALDKLYSDDFKEYIIQAYEDVRFAAGKDTVIIVAGYPRLIADNPMPNKSVSSKEAKLINDAVSLFNDEIEAIITEMRKTDRNIYFVSVEEEFRGYEAYSYGKDYINPIMATQEYDLKEFDFEEFDIKNPKKEGENLFSSYSMHPNEEGAKAYARCVQRLINKIEKEKGLRKEITYFYGEDGSVIERVERVYDGKLNFCLEETLYSYGYSVYAEKYSLDTDGKIISYMLENDVDMYTIDNIQYEKQGDKYIGTGSAETEYGEIAEIEIVYESDDRITVTQKYGGIEDEKYTCYIDENGYIVNETESYRKEVGVYDGIYNIEYKEYEVTYEGDDFELALYQKFTYKKIGDDGKKIGKSDQNGVLVEEFTVDEDGVPKEAIRYAEGRLYSKTVYEYERR